MSLVEILSQKNGLNATQDTPWAYSLVTEELEDWSGSGNDEVQDSTDYKQMTASALIYVSCLVGAFAGTSSVQRKALDLQTSFINPAPYNITHLAKSSGQEEATELLANLKTEHTLQDEKSLLEYLSKNLDYIPKIRNTVKNVQTFFGSKLERVVFNDIQDPESGEHEIQLLALTELPAKDAVEAMAKFKVKYLQERIPNFSVDIL